MRSNLHFKKKKKKAQAGNEKSNILPPNPRKREEATTTTAGVENIKALFSRSLSLSFRFVLGKNDNENKSVFQLND